MMKIFYSSLMLLFAMSCANERDHKKEEKKEKGDIEFKELSSFDAQQFISADGMTIVNAEGILAETQIADSSFRVDGIDYHIKVLNREGKKLYEVKNLKTSVDHVVMNDKKSKLIILGRSFIGCDLISYDLENNTSTILKSFPNQRNCGQASFIRNGNFLVVKLFALKEVNIVNMQNETITTKLFIHEDQFNVGKILSTDSKGQKAIFLTLNQSGYVAVIYDLVNETTIRDVKLPQYRIAAQNHIVLGPNGDHYYLYHHNSIKKRDIATNKVEQEFKSDHPLGHSHFVDLAVSPDENYILGIIAHRPADGASGAIEELQERVVLFKSSSTKEVLLVKLNQLFSKVSFYNIAFLSNKNFALRDKSTAKVYQIYER